MPRSSKATGTSSGSDPIAPFAHKLTAPRLDQKAIHRAELLARILDNQKTRVVVLQAPAGHGKTTLMQQLRSSAEARGDITGWLSMDDSDNDIHRFYQHLGAMVGGMGQTRGANPAAVGADIEQPEYRADWLISQLLALGSPCSLFFDDLHAVSARPTLAFVREAVAHVPENVQIYIASRSLPELGLSRLTVSEEALIVRAEDLCFTREETRLYFSSSASLQLSDTELGVIHDKTDGWPAALQLFRLALGNPSVRQSLRRIEQAHFRDLPAYLAENVLEQQPQALRDFLVRSSVLTRMSGPLCDELLGIANSEEHLFTLETSGLFVRRVEGENRWFTYHPLFRSFLRDQLRLSDPAIVVTLQRKAAQWFLRNDYPEEALELFLDAGDHERAASVLDQWAHRLVPAAHMMTVEQWSERIPLSELEKWPDLMVKVAWALTFLRRHARLVPLVERLKRSPGVAQRRNIDPRVVLCMVAILNDRLAEGAAIVHDIDVFGTPPTVFDAYQWGGACNARGYAAMSAGDFATAHEFFTRSRTLSEASAASFTTAYALSFISICHVAQGQLQEALALHRTCLRDTRMYADESIAQASLVASHVMALYEANHLADAEKEFFRFRDVIARAAVHDHLAVAYMAVARIHDARGQHGNALEILDEAETISYASQWPRIGELIQWERVRRELVAGNLDRAKAFADRAEHLSSERSDFVEWIRYSEDVHGPIIGRLRLKAYCHDPDEALRAILPVLNAARHKRRVYRQIKLLQFAAIAGWRKNAGSDHQKHLQEALQLAAPGGYVRSFLEEGHALREALRRHLLGSARAETGEGPAPKSFEGEIAAGLGLINPAVSDTSWGGDTPPPISHGLTRRELQILGLLASYASTHEMQQKLNLSGNGLKFHLKNIYLKLGVNSRVEAIRVAKTMRL